MYKEVKGSSHLIMKEIFELRAKGRCFYSIKTLLMSLTNIVYNVQKQFHSWDLKLGNLFCSYENERIKFFNSVNKAIKKNGNLKVVLAKFVNLMSACWFYILKSSQFETSLSSHKVFLLF